MSWPSAFVDTSYTTKQSKKKALQNFMKKNTFLKPVFCLSMTDNISGRKLKEKGRQAYYED